jgi:hypothetical protein
MTKERPRLLIVSFSEIAADARVLKQVQLFAERYDVTTCGYGGTPLPGVRHLALPDSVSFGTRGRIDMVLRRYRRMYWTNPAIMAARALLTDEPPFDVVLADDVETVGLALSLAPRAGVHADIHEYAPRQAEELAMWRWFVAPYVRWMCRRHLRRAASVTTVGAGIAREYRRRFGVEADVVTNAAPYAPLAPTPAGEPLRIVHSGAALRNRHIELMMTAVARSSADLTLDLYLMPNDRAYLAELRELAASSPRLTIHEPVPYASLLTTLNAYDLGIHVIPPTNFNNEWSLPNKFFDYVQARLGLVIGPSKEMRDVLERHDLGAVAAGFDVDDVVALLDTIEPGQVAAWKSHADEAARPLSSEAQSGVWADAIERLVARAAAS